MSKPLYFAYGSNLHPTWLNSRVPSASPVSNITLVNWKLYFHKRSDDNSAKCNIIKTDSDDDVIHGTIYEFNSDEKRELDKAERGYTPETMKLDEFGDVLVYLANTESIENDLPIYTWYHDIVLAGAEFHNLPNSYIEYIKSFKTINDPNTNRDKEKRSIAWPK